MVCPLIKKKAAIHGRSKDKDRLYPAKLEQRGLSQALAYPSTAAA
jgi:hypothetical protein